MKEWMDSQSLDLADLLDTNGNSGSARVQERIGMWKGERLREGEWFRKEWVKDAVGMYLARNQQAGYKQ
jgi:hypothetical protein